MSQHPSSTPPTTQARTVPVLADPISWVLIVAAMGALAYGGYMIYGGSRQIGPFLCALGVSLFPIRIISLIGGVGMVGVAIWCAVQGVHLYAVLFGLLGLMTVAERAKSLRDGRPHWLLESEE